ncbi:MAG: 2-oxoglutarate dehydrogenase complex dihydrolipoyllysine-residue succinyltransferase [Bacteroidales bacterium]|nr:2-oxoglutarate dehydrogenase complex dihydrolipoyllysine-residue succinyltransferase [Bacteroidales bacterium]
MMNIEIHIPTPGESVTEVDLARWLVADGDFVEKDQEIAEIESDKATLPLIAGKPGKIKILVPEGETVKVGTLACTIDTSVRGTAKVKNPKSDDKEVVTEEKTTEIAEPEASKTAPAEAEVKVTPLAKKMMQEEGLGIDDIIRGLRKISSKDVRDVLQGRGGTASDTGKKGSREVQRESMSQLRRKLAGRLVSVKNETAMLTTFSEVDMSEVVRMRKQHQKAFTETHGVKLGFMSFFVKASTIALMEFPKVNSQIDGDNIVIPDFVDISIAVQTDKGLMVPVLRNTETMSLADIEKAIVGLAEKARKFRLSIGEMSGGTFSITNGGIFGSMLSTPILNPPQSGILGMHNIEERPIALDGQVVIHPMMYIALSYDHRIVDGRDSVSFLKRIKELIEDPRRMLLDGADAERAVLGI